MESKPVKIHIAGFPKSGNTWAAKLIANLYKCKLSDDNQIHREYNERAIINNDNIVIYKSHNLSESFFKHVDPNAKKVIYIYRNAVDVLNSSVFYWNIRRSKEVRVNMGLKERIKCYKNPYHALEDEHRVFKFVKDFTTLGISAHTDIKNWKDHIEDWEGVNGKDGRNILFVSYENLKENTKSVLKDIVEFLDISNIKESEYDKAIESESFKKRKEAFSKNKDKSNNRFLRSATKNDWKNYLEYEYCNQIDFAFGEKIKQLGYSLEKDWYKQQPKKILLDLKFHQKILLRLRYYWFRVKEKVKN